MLCTTDAIMTPYKDISICTIFHIGIYTRFSSKNTRYLFAFLVTNLGVAGRPKDNEDDNQDQSDLPGPEMVKQ